MEKDAQYKINCCLDEEDGFYHIKVFEVETGKQCACLYAKDKDVLNRNVEALKKIYSIVEIENQGEL